MKQLDKLLFEQGGNCFFCNGPLEKADASIEHLFAQANGGTNAEENLVACCKTLNALLGSKPLKEKFQIVLRQRGPFRCPSEVNRSPAALAPVAAPKIPSRAERADGAKGVPSQPARPILVASKTGEAQVKHRPTAAVAVLAPSVQCPTCKHRVPAAVGQSDYVCSHCRGAFRY